MSIFMFICELHEITKRWVAELTPGLDLHAIEFVVIVARSRINAEMLWIKCLHNDPSRLCAASCSSGNLCEQCEGALGRSVVWQAEGDIRRDNTHQGDAW